MADGESKAPDTDDEENDEGALVRVSKIIGKPMAWLEAWERERARKLKLHAMVAWYDPVQLVKTGADVIVSSAIGSRVDFRLLEALGDTAKTFDFSKDGERDREEVWIDYVADVGDGWNSTYAIAQLLAREELDCGDEKTPRGSVLILGGDAVYPTASKRAYEERFVEPYRRALPEGAVPKNERPTMFAIPGNHDWYDGLVSFSRLFCEEKDIGAWKTAQKGSYFAIQLPHRVWLLAIDIQLEADIDRAQLAYFRRVVSTEMNEGDRVIVLTAEPDWVHAARYDPKIAENIAAFDDVVREKACIIARIAGDLHHYRRHVCKDGVPYITSGGGGAFLHPTFPPLDEICYGDKKLKRVRKSTYPSAWRSWWLTWLNVFFFFMNWKLGIVTALVYTILASAMPEPAHGSFWNAVTSGVGATLDRPSAPAVLIVVVLAFIGFTDTHRISWKVLGGTAHASMHLTGALLIAWATHLVWPSMRMRLLNELVGGFVLGPTLFGIYLAISLAVFRRHANEAFSSLAIEGYKNFLRLHVDREGRVTIYAFKMHEAPKCKRSADGRSFTQSEQPKPELIEKFTLPPFRRSESS